MFGLMFATPLYFQDVQGSDSLITGLKMLPMIGGLVVGAQLAARLQTPRVPRGGGEPVAAAGFRAVVAVGFVFIALGLGIGARTGDATGAGYAALWFVIMGFGLGFAMPASTNAALGELSKERSGVGSAIIMALRQVGATIGVALLGTILGSVYTDRLNGSAAAAALPAAQRAEAGQSVTSGVGLALKAHNEDLLTAARDAFVHGMDDTLLVCTVIAVAGAVLAAVFLPRRAKAAAAAADATAPAPAGPAGASATEEETSIART